ncbi:MAG: hypothetical protein OXH00_15735 [Candidatus Poribacteria bacterium]|nr:hypothetical protein [Candidatus Poribacteria bacterium]
MFHRKWHWILAALFVLSIGGFGFFNTRTQQEPIKIYKMVIPNPKTRAITETNTERTKSSVQHEHDHDHPHGTLPPASNDEVDWRDDSAFDSTVEKNDPWKQTYPQQASTDDTDDKYPPRDWYKTEDPELHAEYFYAQLLKQFGDIPEVHIIGEHKLQIAKKVPITDDQWIKYLEASQVLWPNEKNAELLEALQKDKVEEHQ